MTDKPQDRNPLISDGNPRGEVCIIYQDKQPLVAVPYCAFMLPKTLLDAYSEQYAIPRKGLWCDVVQMIPEIKIPGINCPHPKEEDDEATPD